MVWVPPMSPRAGAAHWQPAGAANTAWGAGDAGWVVMPGVSPKGLLGIVTPTGLGLRCCTIGQGWRLCQGQALFSVPLSLGFCRRKGAVSL